MPEYLSPGVYVEEIDAGPKPIEGVSTSTVGAVGVTALGPTSGKPVLVTSFAEFQRKFGGFLAEPDPALVTKWLDQADGGTWWRFPLSVKGFFDNGGQRMYVKRVFSSKAKASEAPLGQGIVSPLVKDATPSATEIEISHVIGIAEKVNNNVVTIKIFRGDNKVEISPPGFQVTRYDPASGRITLSAAVGSALLAKRGDFVEILPIVAANTTVTFTAKSMGTWGNDLAVRVRPMVGALLRILPNAAVGGSVARTTLAKKADPGDINIDLDSLHGFTDQDRVLIAGGEYTVTIPAATTTLNAAVNKDDTQITVTNSASLANGDKISIEGTVYTLSNKAGNTFDILPKAESAYAAAITVRKRPLTVGIAPAVPAGESWTFGAAVQRLRKANTPNNSNDIDVAATGRLYIGAMVELDNGKNKETRLVTKLDGDKVTLDGGKLLEQYHEGQTLRLIEAEVSARYGPASAPFAEENFTNLRLVKDGSLSSLIKHINTRSSLIEATEGASYAHDDLAKFPCADSASGWRQLANGDDKIEKLTSDDFVGMDGGSGKRTGIQSLEDIDEISICVAPGMWAQNIQSGLIQHCEILKDRFAIIDPPDRLDIEGIRKFREPIDTKYAALYYPWIEVRDPSVSRNVNVAPSGHMAGIYARVDIERGVHKAPANEVVRGITKIAQDVTKREQDMLNPGKINAIRFFPGRGNRVWGARVVTSDSAWKYINVRRLFISVEESIDEGTQWVVFEPNDEPLWARVRQSITNYLTTVWRTGALEGTKAEQAFFVKCDRSTMTQDDIDNGKLICLIGIAPVKPAEFVIFRIQQKTRDAQST